MKCKFLILPLLFIAGSIVAQVPKVEVPAAVKDAASTVAAAGDAAYLAAKEAFNKIVKDIPFAYGSAELKLGDPKYMVAGVNLDQFMKNTLIPALAKLVSLLPAGKVVNVEGNACKTGSEEASDGFVGNIALSQQRAESVKQYILDNSKIDGSRLKVVARGSSSPKAGTDPAAVKNCRVSLKVE